MRPGGAPSSPVTSANCRRFTNRFPRSSRLCIHWPTRRGIRCGTGPGGVLPCVLRGPAMSPGPARAITGPLADMRALPLIFYAAATTAYGAHFAWRDPRLGRLATGLLAAGLLAHTFLIGVQTVQGGHAPLVGTTAALSAFVWLLGL